MKLLGKVTAAALSLAMMTAGISSISAKAFDVCDVNYDNHVDVADKVLVSRYLAGDLFVIDYQRLDVNRSQTIDQADVDCISAKIGLFTYSAAFYSRYPSSTTVAFPTLTYMSYAFPIKDGHEMSTQARDYKRYSYVTNTELTDYSLTPTSSQINSVQEPDRNVVDGESNFIHVNSNYGEATGIVNINGTFVGFIVDDHIIATVAHGIYYSKECPANSFWHTINSITAYNADGTLSNTTFTPVEAHVPKKFAEYGYTINSSEAYCDYDYALIYVQQDLHNYPHFSLGASYNLDEDDFSGVPLYVTGSPASTQYGSNSNHELYSQQGDLLDITINYYNTNSNFYLLYHNIDTNSGDSGAPIYTITQQTIGNTVSYVYTALAIQGGGLGSNGSGGGNYNYGARVTKYMLQFYKTNPYINN